MALPDIDKRSLVENREFWRSKAVVVTGGSGFLGSHVIRKLAELNPKKILIPRSSESDLRYYNNCLNVCNGADVVIHLAADVGGIGYNQEHPYDLAYNNLAIGINIVQAALATGVEKFVGVGTICEYPKHTPIPFKEEDLWNGYPEETNAPYGMAKKMLLVLTDAARQQYGLNAIHIMPVNLYGPGDNFSSESSHVIPALIKKFVEAKQKGLPSITVWGTGNATREFLYIEDAAEGILMAAQKYDQAGPVNLGVGFEISIRDLAQTIKRLIDYLGDIVWDTSKPDGQPRRMLDISKAEKAFGFRSTTSFEEGLRNTIDWYLKQNP